MEIDATPVVVLAASPQLLTCAVACVEHCDAGDEQAKEIGEPIRMSSQWLSERWSRSEYPGPEGEVGPLGPPTHEKKHFDEKPALSRLFCKLRRTPMVFAENNNRAFRADGTSPCDSTFIKGVGFFVLSRDFAPI